MSRKNKTLRAFLHQNENPTIQQAWDHAWKGAQKEFHARSMQELRATNDRLVEALREVTASLAWNAHGECRRLTDGPITPSNIAVEKAIALLAQLDTKGEE